MKKLLTSTFLLIGFLSAYSQDFEGTITFETSYLNYPKEMQSMLPDEPSISVFSIKGSKSKMEMDMMGQKMIMISDLDAKKMTSYIDMGSQKVKSTSSLQSLEDITVEYITEETKTIAGYKCKKAVIKDPDLEPIEVFFSEELGSDALSSLNVYFSKLKGFPLEYKIQQNGMTLKTTAIEVNKKSLDSDVFNPPKGEYKEAPNMGQY